MDQNKTPGQDPKHPSHRSDPQKLRDLINRFSHHAEHPKKEEPAAVPPRPPVVPPPAPVVPVPAPEIKKEVPKPVVPEPVSAPVPAPAKSEPPKVEIPKAEPPKVAIPKAEPPKKEAVKPVAKPEKKEVKKAKDEPIKAPKPIMENLNQNWLLRNKKTVIIIVASVLVLFFGGKFVIGLFQKAAKPSLKETMAKQQQAAKDAPVAVKGFKVGRFNYEDSLNVLGTIKGAQEVKLSFEIPGVVSSINYKEGERYEEGALLVSLKQDDILLRLKRAQAAFNKAESQAKVTENEVAENEKLLKMGAIPASTVEKKKLEMDAAKYEAETQRLEMKANEAMLEKSNLYAPSSGTLGELNISEGENISQSTLVGTHINTEYVYAEFGIVERDVQKISVGQKAKVFVDAYPDKTFEGVIENVAPQISGTSRTSTARVRVENPEGLLFPGMFARVRILLYSKKDAIVIPTDAVQGGEGEKWVYAIKLSELAEKPKEVLPAKGGGLAGLAALVTQKKKGDEAASKEGASEGKDASEGKSKEEGVVEKRPVTIGYTRTDYTQLDAGVTEGELVVLTGFERLEDGKKIRLVETQEAEL